jgi:hypothetical protein
LALVTVAVGDGVKEVGIFRPKPASPEPVEEAHHGH